MSKSIIELLSEDPLLYAQVLEFAKQGNDESLPAAKRLYAFAMVSELMAPLMVEAAKQSLGPPPDDGKPEYKWVKGSRVRIK